MKGQIAPEQIGTHHIRLGVCKTFSNNARWIPSWLLFTLLYPLHPPRLVAQIDATVFERSPPQAQTQKEFNAYLKIVEIPDPSQIPSLISAFARQFPASELMGRLHRIEMDHFAAVNETKLAILAADKALTRNPQDLYVLSVLARLLATGAGNGQGPEENLRRAEDHARRLQREAPNLRVPRPLSLEARDRIVAQLSSFAHEALGIVAFKRGKLSVSVTEFQICIQQNPVPDGTQHYRLGLALSFLNGECEEALVALRRAVSLGPEIIRRRAEEQLSRMKPVVREP